MHIKVRKKWWLMIVCGLLFAILSLCAYNNIPLVAKAAADTSTTQWEIEGNTVIAYNGEETNVTIPSVYEGQTITRIAKEAFLNNTTIESVTIPSSILIMEENVFKGCTSLKSANFGDGMETLGSWAFYGCTNLESVRLPSTLKKIDTYAFGFCGNLATVELPEGLQNIGSASFYHCTSINNIVMPNSVTEIGTHSFRGCSNLSNLTLSTSLKNITFRAFSGCTALTELTFPNGLEAIADEAFYQAGLKELSLPSSLTSVGARAFFECSALKTFTAQGVQTLGEEVFSGCLTLKKVTLPNGATEIPRQAFYKCVKLQDVELPDSVQLIGEEAFKGCQSLTAISMPNALQTVGAQAFYGLNLTEVAFAENLTTVGAQAFSNNRALQKVTFANGVKELQDGAFSGCPVLETVVLAEGLEKIGDNVFRGCVKLTGLNLPNTLLQIGAGAFADCVWLETLVLPAALTEIGDDAFANCYQLIEIYNLSALTVTTGAKEHGGVGAYAKCVHTALDSPSCIQADAQGYIFYNNGTERILLGYVGDEVNLVLPDLGKDTYEIGAYAFYDAKNIKGITIPKCVTKVGNNAFYGCLEMFDVDYKGTEADWKKIEIGEGNTCLLYVQYTEQGTSASPNLPDYVPNVQTGSSFWYTIGNAWNKLLNTVIKHIFVLNFFLILLWGVLLLYNNPNITEEKKKRNKLIFVIIACTQWVLISGLRADSVGDDTENYMRFFDQHAQLSWSKLFQGFGNYITTGEMGTEWYMAMEPLFVLFNKLISVFTTNHVVYKFLVAIIFMWALGLYVYRYSEDPCLSFVLYGALFFNMFSLTGYRQVLSVAIVLFGFRFIKERKLLPFIGVLLIASFFHRTSLIFLLLYVLANKKMTPLYLIGLLAVLAGMIVFRQQVFTVVKVFMGYEEYVGNYGFKQQTFALLLGALTIVAVWRYPYIIKKHPSALQYYNGLILAWLMFPLAMESPSCMRLVYDFGFVLLLLVPLIVKSFETNNERLIVYGAIYALFAVHVITSGFTYAFFW